jgi:hypothetical protein
VTAVDNNEIDPKSLDNGTEAPAGTKELDPKSLDNGTEVPGSKHEPTLQSGLFVGVACTLTIIIVIVGVAFTMARKSRAPSAQPLEVEGAKQAVHPPTLAPSSELAAPSPCASCGGEGAGVHPLKSSRGPHGAPHSRLRRASGLPRYALRPPRRSTTLTSARNINRMQPHV